MYITLAQASEHLAAKGLDGQTPVVLRRAIARGALAAVKDGRAWKTTTEKLDEYEARLWRPARLQGASTTGEVESRSASPNSPEISEAEISYWRAGMFLKPKRPRDLRARKSPAEQRKRRTPLHPAYVNADREAEAAAQLRALFGREIPTAAQLREHFGRRDGDQLASELKDYKSLEALWSSISVVIALMDTPSRRLGP